MTMNIRQEQIIKPTEARTMHCRADSDIIILEREVVGISEPADSTPSYGVCDGVVGYVLTTTTSSVRFKRTCQ